MFYKLSMLPLTNVSNHKEVIPPFKNKFNVKAVNERLQS